MNLRSHEFNDDMIQNTLPKKFHISIMSYVINAKKHACLIIKIY